MNLVVALLTNNIDIVDKYSGDIQIRLLRYFSNDEDRYVRNSVASNPNTPVEILHKLNNDENWYVRRSVANNPYTPVEILYKLNNDEDWYVKHHTLNRLKARGIK